MRIAVMSLQGASAYFILGSILIRDSVHTDREKVSTKASDYTDKHHKKKDQVLLYSNLCQGAPKFHKCPSKPGE